MRNAAGTRREPVFVDRSGRRRRLATMLGIVLGAVALLTVGLLVLGVTGTGLTRPVKWPGDIQQRAVTSSSTPVTGVSARPQPVHSTRPPARR